MAPRRRINPKDKKQPSDYPQMGFRVSEAAKKRLTGLIERAQAHMNARRDESAAHWNKNDVIVHALEKGLAQMITRPTRRK